MSQSFMLILRSILLQITLNWVLVITEAAARRCFSEQVLLEIWQYSQENTCVGISFE